MIWRLWVYILQCLGFDPRGIFSFHDGRRWRHVDPMVSARRLWTLTIKQQVMPGMVAPDLLFDSGASRKLIASEVGSQMQQGFAEIAQAVRSVFDLPSFDDGGLTEAECMILLDRFEDYLDGVKKNGSGSPILLPNTDLDESESSTNSESDSGSTSTDSSSEPPESSDSEQPLETIQQ